MKFNKAVVLGRFQPFHKGHAKLIDEALTVAETVYVVIGSANCYPNIKNPFTVEQRQRLITDWYRNKYGAKMMHRIRFESVSDYRYNDEKWKTEVRSVIAEQTSDKVCMVGFDKDADSYWLREFGWKLHEVEPFIAPQGGAPISATPIRDLYLNATKPADLVKYCTIVPVETKEFLLAYADTESWARLHEEMVHYEKESDKFKSYPYKGSMHFCTADSVVVCNNHLLVIERKFAPGKGAWALPGGHKNENETFKACAIRELMEEVKIKVPEKVLRGSIKSSHLFDHPNRCARFNKPTVAQYIILEPNADGRLPKVSGADDAANAMWIPLHIVKNNPAMFFDDHAEIVTFFTGI